MEFLLRRHFARVARNLAINEGPWNTRGDGYLSIRPSSSQAGDAQRKFTVHPKASGVKVAGTQMQADSTQVTEPVNLVSAAMRQPDKLLKTKKVKDYYSENTTNPDLTPFFSIAQSVSNAARVDTSASSHDSRQLKTYEVEVNGVPIQLEKVGIGKHVVLLMPGAIGSSVTDFTPQLTYMTRDLFQLIAWNPRGYGLSQKVDRAWGSADFFERDAHDAAKLMHNLGFDRYSIMGWSDGGITGLILAALYPQHVHKLVVWGANAYVTKEEVQIYESIRDIQKWSKSMREPFIKMYGEEKFQQLWSEWVDAIKLYSEKKEGNLCKHLLPQIKAPTLVIHGDKDALVPSFHPEYLMKQLPNAKYHGFPDGKHNLHFKYGKEFNSIVEGFLIE